MRAPWDWFRLQVCSQQAKSKKHNTKNSGAQKAKSTTQKTAVVLVLVLVLGWVRVSHVYSVHIRSQLLVHLCAYVYAYACACAQHCAGLVSVGSQCLDLTYILDWIDSQSVN